MLNHFDTISENDGNEQMESP